MKYLSIIRYLLLAVSALVVVLYFVQDPATAEVDNMLRWAYLMIGVTAAAVVLMPIFNILKNPAGAVRSMIGLAIIAIIVLVAYGASDATPITTPSAVYEDPAILKFSDTGLYTTYFMLAASFVSIVVAEVTNMFK